MNTVMAWLVASWAAVKRGAQRVVDLLRGGGPGPRK